MTEKILLCSDCFKDEGLKINSYHIGLNKDTICPNCNSKNGKKLTEELVDKLLYQFFVIGTIHKTEFGGASIIQCNQQHKGNSNIEISDWLKNDLQILEKTSTMGLSYYGPRLWMIGEIEPLKSLLNPKERKNIIKDILEKYPSKTINSDNYFYRVRVNPDEPESINQYCSAPEKLLGNGRLDSKGFPILYGSEIIDLCLHECRVNSEDDIYMAKIRPKTNFRLLDLTELINEDVTEFESLDLAIHFLFLAGKQSYQVCNEICKEAYKSGFDGIIFPSYFSYLATGNIPFETVYGISIRKIPSLKNYAKYQSIPNIGLFGRPILENKIEVESINKVMLTKITYNAIFGPVKT